MHTPQSPDGIGLVSCRELVPDLWDMLDMIVDDLEGLAKLTGVEVSVTA